MYTDHKIESNGKAVFSLCELSQLQMALLQAALTQFDATAELSTHEEVEALKSMHEKTTQELNYFINERTRV